MVCRGCQKLPAPKSRWCTPECKKTVTRLTSKYRYVRFAPQELRTFILIRDNYKCVYCHRKVTNQTANIDHVKPWPLGKTTPRNLVVACKPCNKAKWGSRNIKLKVKEGKRTFTGKIVGRNLRIPKS